jgi:hypothetical protein
MIRELEKLGFLDNIYNLICIIITTWFPDQWLTHKQSPFPGFVTYANPDKHINFYHLKLIVLIQFQKLLEHWLAIMEKILIITKKAGSESPTKMTY